MQFTAAAFAGVVKTYAKDLKAPVKKLSGIGDETWEYTKPNGRPAGTAVPRPP
jgi:hypothetical protein